MRGSRAGRQLASGAPGDGHPRGATTHPGGAEAAAMELCLRLLTAAPRTRAQLDQAMRRRAVPRQAADAVLERLAAAGLVDDATFARAWVESRHHGRGLARRALSAELRQRGVAEGDVRAAVEGLMPEQEAATARRLVAARLPVSRGRPPAARTRQLVGLLARRGYPAGLAYRVVREALQAEGIDPEEAGLGPEAEPDDTPRPEDEPDTPRPGDEPAAL